MLVCFLSWKVFANKGELATNFLAHLPVKVLANVSDNREEALLESLRAQQRIGIRNRTD